MPTIMTHAVSSLTFTALFHEPSAKKTIWVTGALAAMVPDLDVAGFSIGIRYGDLLGHRGLSHSLAFATLFALALTTVIERLYRDTGGAGMGRRRLWLYLFLVTASHGVLDAFTDGGRGIAFLSPISNHRYFFPFRPILVSPIGVTRFLSGNSLQVLASELAWIWLPVILTTTLIVFTRRRLAGVPIGR